MCLTTYTVEILKHNVINNKRVTRVLDNLLHISKLLHRIYKNRISEI